MSKEYDLKMDGSPNTFDGGAIRYNKNKGRFDLIPTNVLQMVLNMIEKQPDTLTVEVSVKELLKYITTNDYVNAILQISCLYNGVCYNNTEMTSKSFKTNKTLTMKCFVMTLKDLAIHFQKGAEKYGERNCEKGIPLWSFVDSGFRHTCQFILCETDEPHYISAIWNFWMAQWTVMKNPLECMSKINICRTHKDPSMVKEVLNKAYGLSGNINEMDYTILDILKEISNKKGVVFVTKQQKKVEEKSDNVTEKGQSSENDTREESFKEDSNENSKEVIPEKCVEKVQLSDNCIDTPTILTTIKVNTDDPIKLNNIERETLYSDMKEFYKYFNNYFARILYIHHYNLGLLDEWDNGFVIELSKEIETDAECKFYCDMAKSMIEGNNKYIVLGVKPPHISKLDYTRLAVIVYRLCCLINRIVESHDVTATKTLKTYFCASLKLIMKNFGAKRAQEWYCGGSKYLELSKIVPYEYLPNGDIKLSSGTVISGNVYYNYFDRINHNLEEVYKGTF